jgi:epoxyqueuosine reductase
MAESERAKLGRRDFLRMAAVGAGATAVVGTSKSVAAESAVVRTAEFSDPAGRIKRPWWVKTVDQPTTEIDWAVMKRYNETNTVRKGMPGYVGQDEVDRYTEAGTKNELQRMLDNVDGYTLKDQALSAAHVGVGKSFLGPQKAKTPEERSVPVWTGTPDEGARVLRAAMRHFGAATVGFFELDDNTRKLVYGFDPDGKELIFTDDLVASENETTRFIPNSCKYCMVYTVQMSQETMRRSPTVTGSQTTSLAYKRGETIQASAQEFLRGLGYQGLGESTTNALGLHRPWALWPGWASCPGSTA